jgi:FixJ family two-component response regulator
MPRRIKTSHERSVVVVVEDDPAVLNSIAFALETEGFAVYAFPTGEAMMAVPSATGAACFVIDQKLPGLSGLDLCERLRGAGSAAPVLLITTQPSAATRARAMAGGVEIVEKPLLGDVLASKVRAAAERRT